MKHNKSVLFLISLSQNKIREIEDKGVDYRMFLETIRNYSHVEVHETINDELLSKAHLYEVVIIVGHQVDGCIEMADSSLFPMNKVAYALNPTFNGYLHVAICGSSIIRDNIKACCPNSRVRTSKKTTQLELQLLIYSLLLSRNDLNKETFDYWYEFERNYIKEIQERKDPSDLAKLPCATKLGTESDIIKSSVFAPHRVPRGELFDLIVVLHHNEDNGTLEVEIQNHDEMMRLRDHNVVLNNIHRGDILFLRISFLDATKSPTRLISVESDNPQNVTIGDNNEKVLFEIYVAKEYSCGYFRIVLEYIKDGKCLRKTDENKVYIKKEDYQHEINKEKQHSDFRGPLNLEGNKNFAELIRVNEPSNRRRGRTGRGGEKVSAAFKYEYKVKDKELANQRLVILYRYLLNSKLIHEDTQQQTFIDLFSGGECSQRIVWMDDVNTLADLFRRLVNIEKYVKVKSPYGLWQMVDGHFWDKEGNKAFGTNRLRKTHTPQKKSTQIEIETMVNILNPHLPIEQLIEMAKGELLSRDDE